MALAARSARPRGDSQSASRASMSEAYSNIVVGGLKLKGAGIKKSKKKRESGGGEAAKSAAVSTAVVVAEMREAASSSSGAVAAPRYTDTERRRIEVLERRKHEAAAAGKLKSHRDKVREFNEYLGSLPEHYDLPKVSKGN